MHLNKWKERLFSEERDIQERLFILNVAVTGMTLLVTMVSVYFLSGGKITSVMSLLLQLTLFLIVGIGSILMDKIRVGAIINMIIVIFIFLPSVFFSSGGINGCAPIWFFYNFAFISMIMDGKRRVCFLVMNTVTVTVCYLLAVLKPELVHSHGIFSAYISSLIAIIAIGISVSLLIVYESTLYMTSRVRAEEQRKQIENLNAAQNQFFSSMSHEIRTPINTIIGMNEMILRENITEEVAEDAANIQSASKLLLHLINDILDMSKFQSGQMRLNPVPYHPGDMLSEIVGMLWMRAKEKKLAFHVNVAPEIPAELLGDEVRIKQILINVLNNAIKYTRKGSVALSIQCGRRENGKLHIVYSVSDTGIGIKKENIPYLFTAFQRVDEEKNRHIEGTGLGLSIVKQFVDLMGGEITVNSVYTEGTTFIIDLPQEVVSEQHIGDLDLETQHKLTIHGTYQKSFEAPDAKILVVDDNTSNLLVVKKLLRETRVQIDTATSGAEALRMTLNTEYDVIFMDHLMPEMDGLECRRRILSQIGGRCRKSKIAALTANAGAENRALYAKEGFDGYLVKPISGETLERELCRLLPKDRVYVIGDDTEILTNTISWMQNTQRKRSVAVTTESIADLPEEFIEKYRISVIPHMVCTKEGMFRDGIEIETQGLLGYMQDQRHTVETRFPDVQVCESFFAKQLSQANHVVHLSVSGLVANSGCPAAMEAARAFDNVTVVDSRHLSSGQGLMAIEASRMAREGRSAAEIVESLQQLSKRVHTSFIVDDLTQMARGGQVSQRIANLTRSLLVRPVLRMKNGRLGIGDLCFGSRERAWHRYITRTLRNPARFDTRILFVTYVGLTKRDMDWIREEIESLAEFEQICFQKASPAIAVNCGTGTFGLLFAEKAAR